MLYWNSLKLRVDTDLLDSVILNHEVSVRLGLDLVEVLDGDSSGLSGSVVAKSVLTVLATLLVEVGSLVDSHDDSATKTNVVLQASLCVGDQSVVSPSSQVPDQLGALSKTSGTERVALGNETSRGVDDELTTVSVVTLHDKVTSLTGVRQTHGVNGDQLVGREAVVQLDNLDIVSGHLGLLEDILGGLSGHVRADKLNGVLGEELGGIGGHGNAGNLDSLVLEMGVLLDELLGANDNSGSSVRGGAAVQLGQVVDLGGVLDLVQGVDGLELGVGVSRRVLVVGLGNSVEALGVTVVLVDVGLSGVTEQLADKTSLGLLLNVKHHLHRLVHGRDSVGPLGTERTGLHLLESDAQNTVEDTGLDELRSHVESGGTGGTVVVDVHDGDTGHTELVDNSLARSGVSVDVAGNNLLDLVVGDSSIKKSLDTGLEAHLLVAHKISGLDELGHADTGDVNRVGHSWLLVVRVVRSNCLTIRSCVAFDGTW